MDSGNKGLCNPQGGTSQAQSVKQWVSDRSQKLLGGLPVAGQWAARRAVLSSKLVDVAFIRCPER